MRRNNSFKQMVTKHTVLDSNHISTIEVGLLRQKRKQDLSCRKQSFIHLKEGVSFKISHPSTLTRHNYPPRLRKNYQHPPIHASIHAIHFYHPVRYKTRSNRLCWPLVPSHVHPISKRNGTSPGYFYDTSIIQAITSFPPM